MKVVRTAVQVIGFVATVASFIPGPHQAIAQIVAAAAAVVSAGLAVMAKPPRPGGAQGLLTSYRLDPAAPIPYMIGRTQFAGYCVHRDTWGPENKKQVFVSVYSLGPIQQIEKFTADRREVIIGADEAAIGAWADHMWLRTQLGECPSPKLDPPAAKHRPGGEYEMPNWGPNAKLSGLAASMWIMTWDKDQKYFTNGPPVPGIIAKGVKVYDPRLDSTFPGGSGACRPLQENTYVYSETPHLHALTYALGRWQNGKRRFGIGFPLDAIDVQYFAEAASIDESNGWTVGGVTFSNEDKWNTLKLIMQAGGGQPITLGGRLSGLQSSPKVSAATITSDELVGPASVVATQSQRSRLNGGIPRYRSEAHEWEVVAAQAVRVPAYVTQDGGERTREFVFDLVQNATQARQLTAYQLTELREFGPIELTLKIRWQGLRPGDCATLNIPELGLNNQKVIVLTRSFDVERGGVVMTFRSETDSKHSFALGQAAGAPPMPELSALNPYGPNNIPPAPTTWALSAYQLDGPSGTIPAVRFTGTFTNTIAEEVEFSIREVGTTQWIVVGQSGAGTAEHIASQVAAGSVYEGRVRELVNGYPSAPQILAPVTAGGMQSGSIIGQGPGATAPASEVMNIYVPTGQNSIANSAFDNGTMNCWAAGTNGTTGLTIVRGLNNPTYSGQTNVAYATASGTPAAGTYYEAWKAADDPTTLAGLKRYALPVLTGDRIFASALIAIHRLTSASIQVVFYEGNGALLSEVTVASGGRVNGGTSGDAGNFDRVGGFLTAPSGSRYAMFKIRCNCNGVADPYVFFTQAMLCRVAVNQTAWPAYQPGSPDRFSDKTGENVASSISGQGPGATAPASDVMNLYVPVGQNSVVNSGFETANANGWSAGSNGNTGLSASRQINAGITNYASANAVGTPAAGTYFDAYKALPSTGTVLEQLKRGALPVMPGDRIFASILAAKKGLTSLAVNVQFLDGAGVFVSEINLATGGLEVASQNGDPVNFTRIGGFTNIAAGSTIRYAYLNVRANAQGGVANPTAYFTQSMLCKVAAGQTAWPVYQAGSPDRFSDKTGENVASSITGQGPGATAPGTDVLNQYVPGGDANRVRYSRFEAGTIGWQTQGSSSVVLTTGVSVGKNYLRADITYNAAYSNCYIQTALNNQGFIPVTPGERLLFTAVVGTTAGSQTSFEIRARWFDATGAELAGSQISATILGNVTFGSTRQGGFVTVPAGAVKAIFLVLAENRTDYPQTSILYLADPMVVSATTGQTTWPSFTPGPSSEYGADVTTQIVGPNAANINYDYTGTTISGTVDLTYYLTGSGTSITSGVTAQARVLEGAVNGYDSTSAPFALTVASGVATLSVTGMTTDTAQLEVLLTYGGVTRKQNLVLTKLKSDPPASGGGGGGYAMSQTSGFNPNVVATASTFINVLTDRIQITMPTGKTTARIVVALSPKWSNRTDPSTGPWNLEYKIQRNTGTTGTPIWTDIGTLQNSNPDPFVDSVDDPPKIVSNPGTMNYTFDDTGRTAGSIYEYRVVSRISSGSVAGNAGQMGYTGSVSLSAP